MRTKNGEDNGWKEYFTNKEVISLFFLIEKREIVETNVA